MEIEVVQDDKGNVWFTTCKRERVLFYIDGDGNMYHRGYSLSHAAHLIPPLPKSEDQSRQTTITDYYKKIEDPNT